MDIIHLFSRSPFQPWQAGKRKRERGGVRKCVRVKDRRDGVCVFIINIILTIVAYFGNTSNVRPVKAAELN